MKKEVRNSLLIGLAILSLIVILVFYFGFNQNIFQSNNYILEHYGGTPYESPASTGEFYLKNNIGTYKSTWIGEATSEGSYNDVRISAPSDDIYIKNSFKDGDELIINFYQSDSITRNQNKNEFKITLPEGKIKAICEANIRTEYPREGYLTCGIGDETITFIGASKRGGEDNFKKEIEILLEEEQEIIFYTLSHGSGSGYSIISGNLKITFEPTPKTTYYRLSNNECSQIQIYDEEKTSNDYPTLLECQSKITQDETIKSQDKTDGIIPPSKQETSNLLIYSSIAVIVIFLIFVIYKITRKKR